VAPQAGGLPPAGLRRQIALVVLPTKGRRARGAGAGSGLQLVPRTDGCLLRRLLRCLLLLRTKLRRGRHHSAHAESRPQVVASARLPSISCLLRCRRLLLLLSGRGCCAACGSG
jgi:hypothetical protein